MAARRVESLKKRRDRAVALKPILAEHYPDLTVSLDWGTPLELLVATILSAQCTDERVNRVTPALFERYPDVDALAGADREELEGLIRSTGFYRNKARNIQGMAQRIVAEHGGHVPDAMDELIELPGVARKTANVVLSNAFGRNEGVVVDTHVKRVAGRLGLTGETDPVRVERDLMQVLDPDDWHSFPWRMILHGRQRCAARKPDCSGCEIRSLCPSADRV
ncbi:MAG: endonuclease III [Gemmatimonadota bacterium]|jgi:endonuclease-3